MGQPGKLARWKAGKPESQKGWKAESGKRERAFFVKKSTFYGYFYVDKYIN